MLVKVSVFACMIVAVAAISGNNEQNSISAVEAKCNIADGPCKKPSDCCGGLRCNALTSKCERACTGTGETCKTDEDC